jgi:hypothetical protein
MIKRTFTARLRVVDRQRVDQAFEMTLSYDLADPFAVTASFPTVMGTQEWKFDRQLLLEGSVSMTRHGTGDVGFQYFPAQAAVGMCLRPSDGHADITFPVGDALGFLQDTADAYYHATDNCAAYIDQAIEELLKP